MDRKELTQEEAVRKTNIIMMELYDALEKKLKRYPPQVYIPYCSQQITKSRENPKFLSKLPPHNLIHSIEANCAYHKSGYSDPINWDKFAKIMNVYYDYGDNPFQSYTIHENIERFILMMHRQQFALQEGVSNSHLARTWSLFVNNAYMAKLSEEFEQKYKFTFEQWFHLIFLSWVGANDNAYHLFKRNILLNCEFYKVTQEVIDAFYQHISLTVEQVKEKYKCLREDVEPAFHFLIQPILRDKPIIDFKNGTLIAPVPDLLFLYSDHGMLDLLSDIKGYDISLAKSFEAYIEKLLCCLNNKVKIISNKQLENLTEGKSCDFLIETKNEILLVECKATTFTAKMFTDKAILKNNSTGKIADALVQIYTTAYDLGNGVFDSLSVDKTKKVMGIIVTLGEIPLANLDWYFDSFIMVRAETEKKLTAPIYPSKSMQKKPITMSVETFENMIVIMNNTGSGLMDLSAQKEQVGIAYVGDWNTFLGQNLKPEYEALPIVQENNNLFFKSMGVGNNLP